MKVLILNRAGVDRLRYQDWIADDTKLYMLCNEAISDEHKAIIEQRCERVEYFNNYIGNGNVELRAIELDEEHQFDYLIALNEFDLLRAAKLREMLGLPGQDVASAEAFRDKLLMKKFAQKAGVKVAEAAKVSQPLDVLQFVTLHGLPVVIKPISGGGSVDTCIIKEQAQLEQFLTSGFGYYIDHSPDYMIERFVPGNMYHVDGFVSRKETILCWPSVYATTCHELKNGGFFASYMLDIDDPLQKRISEQTRKMLQHLPLPEYCTFHIEFFHTPDDELYLCEVASRTGGGLIDKMYIEGFDFDLNRNLVHAQLRDELLSYPAMQPKKLQGEVLTPIMNGIVKRVPSECPFEWVSYFNCKIKAGDNYAGAKNSNDTAIDILIEADSGAQMRQHIATLEQWLNETLQWQV